MAKQIIFLDISQWFIKDSELAQTQLLFTDALAKLSDIFENTDVEITLEKPNAEHSTLYITSNFDNSDGIIGIAEQDSTGNPNDIGMINYNEISNVVDEYGLDPQQHSNLIANSITHETGHLMGLEHTNDPNDIMHDGMISNMWNETLVFNDAQVAMINQMVNLTSLETGVEYDYNIQENLIDPSIDSFDHDNPDDTDVNDQWDDQDNFFI